MRYCPWGVRDARDARLIPAWLCNTWLFPGTGGTRAYRTGRGRLPLRVRPLSPRRGFRAAALPGREGGLRQSRAAESIPAWYRKVGLPHMAINSGHITSWENDALDRIKEAVHGEGRTVSAVLIDGALKLDGEAADAAQIAEYVRIMRRADYLGAPLVRITLAPGSSDQAATVDRATARLKQLLPVARELGLKMAIAPSPGFAPGAVALLRIVNGVDPAVLGVALELEGGEHRTMPIEDVTRLAPSVSYLRVKASAFDKYGEETTIDYGDALEPFEKAAYRGTISIGFDGDGDPVTGVIKTRDLLVKEWVASAKTK